MKIQFKSKPYVHLTVLINGINGFYTEISSFYSQWQIQFNMILSKRECFTKVYVTEVTKRIIRSSRPVLYQSKIKCLLFNLSIFPTL